MYAAPLTLLTDLLARHSRALVDRSRRWAPVMWRQPAGSVGTVADAVHHLVCVGAALEHGLVARPAQVPRRLAYDAALSDQLAVVAHDLVSALRAARPGGLVRDVPVERVAGLALAETLLHGYACDHRLPEESAAQAAAAQLQITGGPSYADALLAAGDCLWESG